MLRGLVLVLCLLLPALVAAQEGERPTVGLVLSGGGAKGMAHVGVLRVLEEMHIPVDLVVGTSAGSAVGALYASGMPVREIEQRFIDMDWLSSFRDDPGRTYKPVRRKEDEWRFPVVPGLGIRADGLHVGGGLVAGQNLGFVLNELTRSAALVDNFDELPIPFRAVATDLATGEQVVIGEGSLAEAIRASMSIPGVYAPVEYRGRLLVDGGIANNLPVSVARALGADVVIAVDITDPLTEDVEQLREAFSVVGQMTTLLTRRNTDRQLALLGDEDVLIRPDLQGLTSADFYEAPILFELGASAAREHAPELRRLRVSRLSWTAYKAGLSRRSYIGAPVNRIEIRGGDRLARAFIRGRISQQTGEPLDEKQLEEDLKRIYGLGYFETVTYTLSREAEGTALTIRLREKSWGPNYLSFGLSHESNLDGDARFNVASALRMTEVNRLGGEWHTGIQLGTEPWIGTQWYQPLDYGYKRFLVLGAEYSRDEIWVYDGDGDRIAEADVTFRQMDLGLGMELGNNGEVRLTYSRGYATVDEQVGQSVVTDDSIHQGSLQLRLVYDSLDNGFFPTAGAFAGLRARFEREDFGSERDFDSLTAMTLGTGRWRDFALTGLVFAESRLRGDPGVENYVRLGGFRQLSAYAPGQITGESAALAALYARQRFGGPFMPWFAGAGLEVGNAWPSLSEASWSSALRSWSLFAGVDTFLGPVQIATAYNSEQNWTAYLNIGFSFTQLFY